MLSSLRLQFLATTVARGFGALGSTFLTIVLAREIGFEALGVFAFCLSLLYAAALFARFGYDMTLTKLIPRTPEDQKRALLQYFLIRALGLAAIGGVVFYVVYFAGGISESRQKIFGILFLGLLPIVLLMVISGFLKGDGKPAFAVLLDAGGQAGFALVFLLAYTFLFGQLSSTVSAIIYACTCFGLLTITLFYLSVHYPRRFGQPFAISPTTTKSRTFWVISLAIYLSQAGSLAIAGFFLSDVDIGLLRIAERLSLLAIFFLSVIDPLVASRIVQKTENAPALWRLWKQVTAASTALGLSLCVLLIIFGSDILQKFGATDPVASLYLYILTAAALFNSMTGTTSQFLALSGHEKFVQNVLVLVLAASLTAYPLFTWLFGPWGYLAVYCCLLGFKNSAFVARFIDTRKNASISQENALDGSS